MAALRFLLRRFNFPREPSNASINFSLPFCQSSCWDGFCHENDGAYVLFFGFIGEKKREIRSKIK